MKKIESHIFIVIFIIIIGGFGLFYGASFSLSKQRVASELENRPLAIITMPKLESVISGEYMKSLDNAFQDQTLFRQEMVIIRTALTRQLARIAYLPTADKAIPIDYESSPMLWKDQNILIPPVELLNTDLFIDIDMRAAEYAQVASALPHVSLNIFCVEERSNSIQHPTVNLFKNATLDIYQKYFLEKLTPEVNFSSLSLNTKDKFTDYYYRTDHHLNAEGVYNAYLGIYDLLFKNNDSMGDKLTFSGYESVGLPEFRGSLARDAAYTNLTDDVAVPLLSPIPKFKTYLSGSEATRSSYQDATQITPHGLFIDWYIWYFGKDVGLFKYENPTPPSDKNLLIIGSSFTQSMESYLASHYKTSYAVDLRHYGIDEGKEFNVIDFANENNIDDIIIITTPSGCYINRDTWALLPETRVAQ